MPTPAVSTETRPAPVAFQVAPDADELPDLAPVVARLRRLDRDPRWREALVDVAQALMALAAAPADPPLWGILTSRTATPRDLPEQQDEGRVRIASLEHAVSLARARELVALFESDPHQTVRYTYEIKPFAQMRAEANA